MFGSLSRLVRHRFNGGFQQQFRNHSSVHKGDSAAYEGTGKTTMSSINQESSNLLINSYARDGFRLNNEFKTYGPIVIFPQGVFAWLVSGSKQIDEDSLIAFTLLNPKPDIVIIGYGASEAKLDYKHMLRIKKNTGLNLEWLPTEQAVPTYNYLSYENRNVAAALIPPERITNIYDEDIQTTKQTLRGDLPLRDIENPVSWQDVILKGKKVRLPESFGSNKDKFI